MRRRKILLTTTRERQRAIVRDGAITHLVDARLLTEKEQQDVAAHENGHLFEVTVETRMVKAKQLTFTWEAVRRHGKRWEQALAPRLVRCAYCFLAAARTMGRGRAGASNGKPCRRCKGQGQVAINATFSSREQAIEAMRAAGVKGVARKLP